jgi:hypothetical protein
MGFLPKALKKTSIILNFESIYEKIGIPSLIGQILTGIWMFYYRIDNYHLLFHWNDFIGRHFILKSYNC